jgi:ubiquinone/menaquinone biosynthesis C-methylase UbiE
MLKKLHAVEPLVERFYPQFYELTYPYSAARTRYRHWIRELLKSPRMCRVLDCGCGDGYHSISASLVEPERTQLIGIDVAVAWLSANQAIAQKVAADATAMPFVNGCCDVIVCESVLEHLETPAHFLREAFRVLPSGGRLLILTPGAWHPFMLLNRLMRPARALVAQTLWRMLRRPLSSTFPAFYRCNSKSRLARYAAASGFRISCLETASGTFGYLRFSKWLMMLGIIFDRLTDNRLLDFSKINLLAILEKP